MNELVRYEAACRALAECKAVDEVKAWADKAAAMQAYGRMAQDKGLEIDAAEIRIRAERRLGEMLAHQKADGGLNAGVRMAGKSADGSAVVCDDRRSAPPKLADAGISKDLSSRAQKLAAVPEAEFEAEVGGWRERVSAEGARVSARLQQAGARALKAAAPESFGPSAEEVAEAEASARDDAERQRLILDADDVAAALAEKCQQLQAQVRILESRIAGLTNANAEYIRTIKRMQRQAERAAA